MGAVKIFRYLSQLLDVAVTRAEAKWPRFNADGTVSQRTAAETRSDIGAGVAQLPSWQYTAGAMGSGLFKTDNSTVAVTTSILLSPATSYGTEALGDAFVAAGVPFIIIFTNIANGKPNTFQVSASSRDVETGVTTLTVTSLTNSESSWSGTYCVSFLPMSNSSGDYILIRDEKAQGTSGGTFTAGAWRTRDLNTEVDDTGGYASIGSNQITLLAGTYRVHIQAPAYFCARHQARLYSITDSALVLTGSSGYSGSVSNIADGSTVFSIIDGRFTLSGTKVLEVQHQSEETRATHGFGVASNFGTEVYTIFVATRE